MYLCYQFSIFDFFLSYGLWKIFFAGPFQFNNSWLSIFRTGVFCRQDIISSRETTSITFVRKRLRELLLKSVYLFNKMIYYKQKAWWDVPWKLDILQIELNMSWFLVPYVIIMRILNLYMENSGREADNLEEDFLPEIFWEESTRYRENLPIFGQ